MLEGLQVAVDGSEASGSARRTGAAGRGAPVPVDGSAAGCSPGAVVPGWPVWVSVWTGAGSVSVGATGVAASGSSGVSETVGSSGAVTPPVRDSVSSGAVAPPRSGA